MPVRGVNSTPSLVPRLVQSRGRIATPRPARTISSIAALSSDRKTMLGSPSWLSRKATSAVALRQVR